MGWIVKKVNLRGIPYRVRHYIALIHGMFNSQLEVSMFKHASIRTVSGIRGTIKKGLRPSFKRYWPGLFRAEFEDKLLLSDIVILRAWVPIHTPEYYKPVFNILLWWKASLEAQGARITADGQQKARSCITKSSI